MKDIIPKDLSAVSMSNVITAINNSKSEKDEFRKELLHFSGELHRCDSNDHAEVIYTDYKNRLVSAKNELRKRQGFLNKDEIGSLLVMGTPTSLTSFGAIAAVADPFSLAAISSSMLIGAVASYVDYNKTKSTTKNPAGASYLISLDKRFSNATVSPAFDRHLDEFIND